jgi:glutathione peroxidase
MGEGLSSNRLRPKNRLMTTAHEFSHRNIDGEEVSLSTYSGKVALVVNVASQCGLTPQYAGLEELYGAYKDKGFVVLGFPCNQFGAQEPGTEAEIKTFCETSYGVSFPLFHKLEVNGDGAHPLYAWLTAQPTEPEGPGPIQWNFGKFLIGKDGRILARFKPTTAPASERVVEAIERALAG